jgi:hypothetical protein
MISIMWTAVQMLMTGFFFDFKTVRAGLGRTGLDWVAFWFRVGRIYSMRPPCCSLV